VTMSEVTRAVRDAHRRGKRQEFLDDRRRYLDSYELTDAERQAMVAGDYAALYDMGIHPMAVLFLSQVAGVPMPEYLAAIGVGDQRVGQFTTLFGEATTTTAKGADTESHREDDDG
jgi:Aromatic-ring-opening dioxygenase LigAB, LigA subunit